MYYESIINLFFLFISFKLSVCLFYLVFFLFVFYCLIFSSISQLDKNFDLDDLDKFVTFARLNVYEEGDEEYDGEDLEFDMDEDMSEDDEEDSEEESDESNANTDDDFDDVNLHVDGMNLFDDLEEEEEGNVKKDNGEALLKAIDAMDMTSNIEIKEKKGANTSEITLDV